MLTLQERATLLTTATIAIVQIERIDKDLSNGSAIKEILIADRNKYIDEYNAAIYEICEADRLDPLKH